MPDHPAPSLVDPSTASTPTEFARALRKLRIQSGTPTFREMERRTGGRLPKSTASDIANGKRFPSRDQVCLFVNACGVSDVEPWLRARDGIAERLAAERAPAIRSSTPTGPEPQRISGPEHPERDVTDGAGIDQFVPSEAPRTPAASGPRKRRRLVAVAVAAAVATGVAVAGVALTAIGGDDMTASLECSPADCRADGPRLPISGRLGGDRPAGSTAAVLILVDNTMRWYLGPSIAADPNGSWSAEVGIGAPPPQERDRSFKVCVVLLPDDALPRLTATQIERAGGGLQPAELPSSRAELACRAAVRPSGT